MMESRFVENDVGENGDPSLFQLKDETDLGVGKMADGVQSGQEKRIVVEMGAMGSRDDINNGLISTAERETSAIMTKKISEMAAAGSILIDPTRPDTLLRAEVEALRAICEEPLRTFRRATHLDGPGWKPLNGSPNQMYQLLAQENLVWRCVWSSENEMGFQYENIEGSLLEQAGYLWQRERRKWDRLPAPDEGINEGRVEIEEMLRGEENIDVIMEGE